MSLLGRAAFLKEIQAFIPEHFNDLNTKHTLLLSAVLMSKYWSHFTNQGIGIRKKDFTSLKITVNQREVVLDSSVKNYFPFPNKTYLTYGHQHHKDALLIDLTDDVWKEIAQNGFLDVMLEFELMPNEADKKISFQGIHNNKKIDVAFSTVKMHINVENIQSGEHLVIPSHISAPKGFFRMEDFQRFMEFREPKEPEENTRRIFTYTKNIARFIPRSTDLNKYMWWTLYQDLEFSLKPYSIYSQWQNIDKTKTYESFQFGEVNYGLYHEEKEHPDFFKIIGKVASKKSAND